MGIKNGSSYILRHYRGELSLGVSYWVNNVLLNIAFFNAASFIMGNLDFTNNPVLPSLLVVFIFIFSFFLTPWALIGLWRSAKNHILRYDKHFWPNVVRFLVFIGWIQFFFIAIETSIPQIVEFSRIAIGKSTVPEYNISIHNNGRELKLSGGIRFGLTNEIEKYFIKYPNIRVLHLNSMGGRIAESHKLHDFIAGKNLVTYSSLGCYSACVNVFLAGKYRILRENAYLGFHQPGFTGISNIYLSDVIEQEKNFYLEKNIKSDFVEKIFSFPTNKIWKPSHNVLLEAGVIHKRVKGLDL